LTGFALSVVSFQLAVRFAYFVGAAPGIGVNSWVRVNFSPVNQ
jgi:hypothetical protein